MRTKLSMLIFLGFSLLGLNARAQPVITARCRSDSLDPDAARRRLDWARRCALSVNVVSPSRGYSLADLTEYDEADPRSNVGGYRTYTGVGSDYKINSTYVTSQFTMGSTTQYLENGFYKWTREASLAKVRPVYPTFGNTADPAAGVAVFPHPTNVNDCNLYPNATGSGPPARDFYIVAYCTSSCYTPEQEILFPDGYHKIVDALEERRNVVTTLAPNSRMGSIVFQTNRVASYTKEIRPAEQIIIEIATELGGKLRVTDDHPVLRSDGVLVRANQLKLGDSLISVEGYSDRISSLRSTSFFGLVYNLKPAASNLRSNVLVAQGFLVGSSAFQNEYVEYMNRKLLGRSVPRELIP